MKHGRISRRRRRKRRIQIIRRLLLFGVLVLGFCFLIRSLTSGVDDGNGAGDGSSVSGNRVKEIYTSILRKDEIEQYAKKNGYTLDDYPQEMIDLYEKNPETKDFVLEYPMKKDTVQEINLGEYASADEVPLLMQWDQRWGYKEYAGAPMGLSGCGPTCLSMVTIYLTGDTSKNPVWMADFATEHGYAVDGVGSDWSLMSRGGMELGLDVTEIPADRERVENNLSVGNPIIAIMGPGDFTSDGHFIVLTGMEDGKWTVNDPNSRKNSEKDWDPDTVLGQARDLWVFRNVAYE